MIFEKNYAFNGFSEKTREFLRNLELNNNKSWFESHREDFQEHVLQPLQNLVMDLSGFMLSLDPHLETTPAIGKTISRIHRDTRFSKDKSPYRSNLWIAFKRRTDDWKIHPCFFFELFPDWYRFGMGFYGATRQTMDRLREVISERPQNFLNEIAFLEKQNMFGVEGESYKKILNKEIPQNLQSWYQRKNLYLICNRKNSDLLFSRELVDELIAGFASLSSFYHFLWKLSEE